MYHKNAAVYIAGLGVVAAIGNNTNSCLQSLEQSLAGIGSIQSLDTIHRGLLPVAEVSLSNQELARQTGLPAHYSRTALLSMLAAKQAYEDAGLQEFNKMRIGFVSANSVGGMDKSENFFSKFLENNANGRLREVVHHECGSVTEIVANKLGIKHFVSTISTACSSSANSIFFAARLIKHNKLDIAIAGGTDALAKFTLNGFNTLQILDKDFCTVAEHNGKMVGFSLAIPDVNHILIKIKKGRLFPTGIFKLLFQRKSIKKIRIITLGVVEGYRKMGIETVFYADIIKQVQRKGITTAEASWVLEDNFLMNKAIQDINGKPYKKYRIFEKHI